MLSTALLLAASMVGQGGEKAKPGPDYQQLKAMEWMIGDWEAEYVVASPGLGLDGFTPGAKVHSFNSYYWMQNKNYIGFRFRDEIDGKVVHSGFEMIGVDPQSKKTIHWLFSVLGGWGPGEWSVDGKTWKLRWTGTTSDGTKYEGVSFMAPVDANTHTWEMKDCKKNGEPTPDTPIVTYHRVGKTAVAKSESGDHYLAFWQSYFLGEWAVRVVEGENSGRIATGNEGTWSCQLAPTKTCMLFSLAIDGSADSNAIAGFDHIANAWKEVAFLANGDQLIHFYRAKPADLLGDPAGKVIKGKAEYISADGKIENSEITITFVDRDDCEYVASRLVGDQKLPFLKVQFKRKK